MKKSIYMLLCAAALVSCGQPKQQQEAVADVATSGNPIFEGWYADPEGIIYGDTYWVFPTWSDAYEKQTHFDCFSSKDLVNWTKHSSVLDTSAVNGRSELCGRRLSSIRMANIISSSEPTTCTRAKWEELELLSATVRKVRIRTC